MDEMEQSLMDIGYTQDHIKKLIKKPWLLDTRFWISPRAKDIPFALRAQLNNATKKEARRRK